VCVCSGCACASLTMLVKFYVSSFIGQNSGIRRRLLSPLPLCMCVYECELSVCVYVNMNVCACLLLPMSDLYFSEVVLAACIFSFSFSDFDFDSI